MRSGVDAQSVAKVVNRFGPAALILAGFGLLIIGVWQWSGVAAMLLLGVLLIWLACAWAYVLGRARRAG